MPRISSVAVHVLTYKEGLRSMEFAKEFLGWVAVW